MIYESRFFFGKTKHSVKINNPLELTSHYKLSKLSASPFNCGQQLAPLNGDKFSFFAETQSTKYLVNICAYEGTSVL